MTMRDETQAMIRALSAQERRALVGIWVDDSKLVTKRAARSLKSRGVLRHALQRSQKDIEWEWEEVAFELARYARALGYVDPKNRTIRLSGLNNPEHGDVWYVMWVFVANYSDKPYCIRAGSADEAARRMLEFFGGEFAQKAQLMVSKQEPRVYRKGRDVSRLTAEDMEGAAK